MSDKTFRGSRILSQEKVAELLSQQEEWGTQMDQSPCQSGPQVFLKDGNLVFKYHWVGCHYVQSVRDDVTYGVVLNPTWTDELEARWQTSELRQQMEKRWAAEDAAVARQNHQGAVKLATLSIVIVLIAALLGYGVGHLIAAILNQAA